MRRFIVCAFLGVAALIGSAVAADAPKTKAAQSASPERPRIAYTAYRVLDADRSLKFYVSLLGMKERQRIPLGNDSSEILIGYGDPTKDAGILLLYNPNHKEPYTHGDGYHRLIVDVSDLQGTLSRLKENGVKVVREPTRVENLKLSYAFISDPDGYMLELVQSD
jgi:lactoylglutathione lyase